MKRIVIDARLAGLRHAGLGRYLLNLLDHLPQVSPKDFDYHLIILNENLRMLKKRWGQRYRYHSLAAGHYSWREQWSLPLLTVNLKPDLLYFPHFNIPLLMPWPFVVTIHDLIKHHSLGMATTSRSLAGYKIKRWGYHLTFSQAVRRARAIIVPSQWTANDLKNYYPNVGNKVKVVYEGVDGHIQFRQKTKLPDGVKPPFLLYVGSLYPHKNLEVVLRMMKNWPAAPPLVVVSARSIFRERFWRQVVKMGLEGKIILAGFVSDAVLGELYRQAIALVFPSRLEGFGLPGLEAMANNCPVIAARATALPEVYGSAAVYFAPRSVRQLTADVKKIMDNRKWRQQLQKRGRRQVKKYSWRKMARQIAGIYRQNL